MSQKERKGNLIANEKGLVWDAVVGIQMPKTNSSPKLNMKTKLWKIKVILN